MTSSSLRNVATLACIMMLVMIDGFDTQSIGFAGPAIIADWQLQPSDLGPILSSGLLGALIGALLLGPLGDRLGRPRMILFCVTLFSIGMVATAATQSIFALLTVRLVTGIGLGGALPNLLAFAASQLSERRRSTGLSVMIVGVPLGASLGGFGTVTLIDAYGWQGMFIIAGLLPLPILAALIILLRSGEEDVRESGAQTAERRVIRDDGKATIWGDGVLAPRYRLGTVLLWMACFFGVMLTYTLTGWLPTLLTLRAYNMEQAVMATALLNLFSVVGGVAVGRCSDTFSPFKVIAFAYLLGSVALVLIGEVTAFSILLAAIGGAALFALGGQTGMGALSATFYEARLRATGVGLCLAIGRAGAVAGPLLVTALLASGVDVPLLFWIAGGQAVLIALLFVLIAIFIRNRPGMN